MKPVKQQRKRAKGGSKPATMAAVRDMMRTEINPCYNDFSWGATLGSALGPTVDAAAANTTFFLNGIPIFQGGPSTEKEPFQRLSQRIKPTALEVRLTVANQGGAAMGNPAQTVRILLVVFHQAEGQSFTLPDVLALPPTATASAAPFSSWNWESKTRKKFTVLLDVLKDLGDGGPMVAHVSEMIKLRAPIIYIPDPMGGPGTSPADVFGDSYWLFINDSDTTGAPSVQTAGIVRMWFEDLA